MQVESLLRDVGTLDPAVRHDVAAQLSKVAAKAEGAECHHNLNQSSCLAVDHSRMADELLIVLSLIHI